MPSSGTYRSHDISEWETWRSHDAEAHTLTGESPGSSAAALGRDLGCHGTCSFPACIRTQSISHRPTCRPAGGKGSLLTCGHKSYLAQIVTPLFSLSTLTQFAHDNMKVRMGINFGLKTGIAAMLQLLLSGQELVQKSHSPPACNAMELTCTQCGFLSPPCEWPSFDDLTMNKHTHTHTHNLTLWVWSARQTQ